MPCRRISPEKSIGSSVVLRPVDIYSSLEQEGSQKIESHRVIWIIWAVWVVVVVAVSFHT